MILLETQADINLLGFYVLFFTVLISGFSIATLIRSNVNYRKRNAELSQSLYECREYSNNFNDITEKLKGYEKDIEQIEESRRGKRGEP